MKLDGYQRYLNHSVEVADWKNFIGVHADLFGWQKEYNELINGTIEEKVNGGVVKTTDFTKIIKSHKIANDKTNFRPYYTILTTVYNLCSKNKEENGVTAQAVSAFSNINLQDVYTNLNKLATEGYLEKMLVSETPEWENLLKKEHAEKGYKAYVAKLTKGKDAKVNALKKQCEKEIRKLQKGYEKLESVKKALGLKVSDEEDKHILRLKEEATSTLDKKIIDINKTYDKQIAEGKPQISEAEKEFLKTKRQVPDFYYKVSEKGKNFVNLILEKYPVAFKESQKIWDAMWNHMSAHVTLQDRKLKLLNIYSIPETELNESFERGYFRKRLLTFNQLLEEQVTIFYIYRDEFKVKTNGVESTEELSYATGRAMTDNILAKVFVDKDGRIWTSMLTENYAIGRDCDSHIMGSFTNYENIRAFVKGKLTEDYLSDLKSALRNDKLQLGETPEEREVCDKKLGLIGKNNLMNVVDTINTKAIILSADDGRIEIPEKLENVLLFTPGRIRKSESRRREPKA